MILQYLWDHNLMHLVDKPEIVPPSASSGGSSSGAVVAETSSRGSGSQGDAASVASAGRAASRPWRLQAAAAPIELD